VKKLDSLTTKSTGATSSSTILATTSAPPRRTRQTSRRPGAKRTASSRPPRTRSSGAAAAGKAQRPVAPGSGVAPRWKRSSPPPAPATTTKVSLASRASARTSPRSAKVRVLASSLLQVICVALPSQPSTSALSPPGRPWSERTSRATCSGRAVWVMSDSDQTSSPRCTRATSLPSRATASAEPSCVAHTLPEPAAGTRAMRTGSELTMATSAGVASVAAARISAPTSSCARGDDRLL
jgi:hypothetical protein